MIKFNKICLSNNLIFLSVVVILSLFARGLIAQYRYLISHDEPTYIRVAINLFMGKGLSEDGITPHLLFPPLYSYVFAGVFYFFRNVELTSKLIYIFFGGIVCLPLYYLALRFYNRRVARLSSLLMVFFPSWLLSKHFWQASSEQLYILLFVSGMLIFTEAIFKQKLIFFALSGVVFGLTYLGRPEGLVFLLAGTGLIFIAYFMPFLGNLFKVKFVRKVICLCLFWAAFLIAVAPYLIYLKKNLGHWTISGKLDIALEVSKQYSNFYKHASAQGAQNQAILLVKRYFYNFSDILKSFGHLGFFPFYLLPFIALGFFRKKWDKESYFKEIFLFLFFISTFLVVAIFFVNSRYLMPTFPILIIWIANGIARFEDCLLTFFNNFKKTALLKQLPITVIIFIFLLSVFLQLKFKLTNPMEYKELGDWIKGNIPQKVKIISRNPDLSFYAEREVIAFPANTDLSVLGNILKYAKENKAEYLAVEDIRWSGWLFPDQKLEYLLRAKNLPDSLEIKYENHKYGRRFIFYKLHF